VHHERAKSGNITHPFARGGFELAAESREPPYQYLLSFEQR
jgi:hypothetical protein